MVQILEFAVLVISVSASGVMAPGPLFAANIAYGLKGGAAAGIRMAAGHAVVELPLVIILGIGAFSLDAFPGFRTAVSVLGAVALFVFAAVQVRGIFRGKNAEYTSGRNPFVAGAVLSALNPFFITWWLTIGLKLISDAMIEWAFAGVLVMFALHIWMDFAWLGAVGFLAAKSTRILSSKGYKILIVMLSVVLVYFGITFLEVLF